MGERERERERDRELDRRSEEVSIGYVSKKTDGYGLSEGICTC